MLRTGLTEQDGARVMDALAFVEPLYQGKIISSAQENPENGQDAFEFVQGVAGLVAQLETDADTRIAAFL
ncbi:MAG TPA: hypothetical protein VN019_10715, partial [Oxalicibacterium sp.]|nr:hypothetical protein [Oxalicibacterium sp.]